MGEAEEALKHLRTAVELAPTRESYWREFLAMLAGQDRAEGVLGEILLEIGDEQIEFLAWLLGRLDGGGELVVRLEEETEGSEGKQVWRLLYLLARYRKNRGESGRALELYQRVADSGGDGVGEVLRDTGECHLDLGAPEAAKEYLEKALAVNPRLEWVHYHLGIVCENSGDTEGARAHYLETLKINRNSQNCLMAANRLSARSLAVGDLSSAREWLKRAESFR